MFSADKEFDLKRTQNTVRTIYASHRNRNALRQHSRTRIAAGQLAMLSTDSNKPRCHECGKPNHFRRDCNKYKARLRVQSGGRHNSGDQRSKWCFVHNTHKHIDSECRAQRGRDRNQDRQQQSVTTMVTSTIGATTADNMTTG